MPEPEEIEPTPETDPELDIESQAVADVRPLPVLAEARPLPQRIEPPSLPAAVAAATGGFLLGVATFLLVRVLRRPKGPSIRLGGRKRGRKGDKIDIAASRSFLVDVHLLDRR